VPFVDVVLQIALGIAFTSRLLRWDTRRLGPERFARSWNDASFWIAVVVFGPLSIPVHFARTRRSFAGFALGVAEMAVVLFAIGILTDAIDRLIAK
jgi:hypothetical protein